MIIETQRILFGRGQTFILADVDIEAKTMTVLGVNQSKILKATHTFDTGNLSFGQCSLWADLGDGCEPFTVLNPEIFTYRIDI